MTLRITEIILSLLLVLSVTKSGYSQESKTDSLNNLITITDDDTIKTESYIRLGKSFLKSNPDSAFVYFTKAVKLADKLIDEDADIDKNRQLIGLKETAIYMQGLVVYYQYDYDRAINLWNKSLELSLKIEDTASLIRNYYAIGLIYYSNEDYKKAIDYLQKAINLYEEQDGDTQLVYLYEYLGNLYAYAGKNSKAKRYFKKALKLSERLKDKDALLQYYDNISLIYSSQNDYEKAIVYYKKRMAVYEKRGDSINVAEICINVGIYYEILQEYETALEYYNRAVDIYFALGNESGYGTSIANMAGTYLHLNNFEKALEYYQKALEININENDKINNSATLLSIGSVYFLKKNYSKALDYYQAALIIADSIKYDAVINTSLNNIGETYHAMGENQKAIDYYQKALRKAISKNDDYGIAIVYNNLGEYYADLGDFENAKLYANKGLKQAKEIKSISYQKKSYQILSTADWAMKNESGALKNLNKVIEIENIDLLLNFSFISEKQKQLYFQGIEEIYWRYNSFALDNKENLPSVVDVVFDNTLKNKGLLLKSNTAMRNAIYKSKDSLLIEEYENWIALKRWIAKKYEVGDDVSEMEKEADSLEALLVKTSYEFSEFNMFQNISWKQVKNNLRKNDIAIEFTHFRLLNPDSSYTDFTNQVQYVALVLTKKSKYPEMIPLFEEKQLEAIIGKFGGNNYSYINGIYGGKNVKAIQESSLYNLIWAPIDNYLDSIGMNSGSNENKIKVYISPDGLLHKISFPAIAKEQDIYLCDSYDIEIKSTTGKIAAGGSEKTIRESSRSTTATIFGGINYNADSTVYQGWTYLKGTKIETQEIDKILKEGGIKVNYYTSSSATENEFKQLASSSSIIHIATHGFFYPDPKIYETDRMGFYTEVKEDIIFRGGSRGFGVNTFVKNRDPLMRSGLVFAGANDVWSKQNKNDSIDDGVLTAKEVSNIDMRKTELVVMSACETGLGDIKGSEGVYGLQRAFKMAGVDYMIMSLWQVPDKETEEFMTKFYKKLIKNDDIKQAFAETQKEMRAKYDPYFWAAFVLVE